MPINSAVNTGNGALYNETVKKKEIVHPVNQNSYVRVKKKKKEMKLNQKKERHIKKIHYNLTLIKRSALKMYTTLQGR